MTQESWGDLLVTTVVRPAEAARRVLALDLPREALWTAILLVAVINTIIFTASNMLWPMQGMPTPSAPVYFFFAGGSIVLTIITLFWAGRMFGGKAEMTDIMSIIVWLQVPRIVIQSASLVLVAVLPALAGVLMVAASIVGIWIMLHFVNEAHRFGSLGRAAGVMVAAFVAMVIGLSAVLSFAGIGFVG